MTRLESVHPVLMCRDVKASLEFYGRLGFTVLFRDDHVAPRYAALRRDGVEIHLQWGDERQWAYPIDRPVYRFVTDNVDALYVELEDHLSNSIDRHESPWRRPGDTPWGTREFHLRDLDGNGLQFYSSR
jgi:catechol 2,3-dioxygenase-like lactoylglutathione lyase family enzyme